MTLNHDNCLLSQKCWFSVLENSSLTKKKEKNVRRTKIDFFVMTKRSLLICFSRVLVIWKFLKFDCKLFLHRRFLHCRFFLDCRFLLDCKLLALNDFYQSFFVLNANVITIVENENICLSQMTLLSNEFEELVCCSKRFCLCKQTRDKYWISNSTYNDLY
jgi:hypothetical protein